MKVTPFTFESLTNEPETTTSGRHSFVPEDFGVKTAASKAKEETPPSPPPPSFSEEELEAAKKQAQEEGFMAGKKEGQREAENAQQQNYDAMTMVLSRVEQQFTAFQMEQQQNMQAQRQELSQLVMACAQRVAGEALRKDSLSDIQEVIDSCLSGLFGAPELEVCVHPLIAKQLEGKLPKQVTITADADLPESDCTLQWLHGEANRDIEKLWKIMDEKIQRYFSTEPLNEGETHE